MAKATKTKPKKTKLVAGKRAASILFDPPLFDALQERAIAEDRSITGQVVSFVKEGLGLNQTQL
jgi:hypothetical protein